MRSGVAPAVQHASPSAVQQPQQQQQQRVQASNRPSWSSIAKSDGLIRVGGDCGWGRVPHLHMLHIQQQRRQLDAFHTTCLRRILGIILGIHRGPNCPAPPASMDAALSNPSAPSDAPDASRGSGTSDAWRTTTPSSSCSSSPHPALCMQAPAPRLRPCGRPGAPPPSVVGEASPAAQLNDPDAPLPIPPSPAGTHAPGLGQDDGPNEAPTLERFLDVSDAEGSTAGSPAALASSSSGSWGCAPPRAGGGSVSCFVWPSRPVRRAPPQPEEPSSEHESTGSWGLGSPLAQGDGGVAPPAAGAAAAVGSSAPARAESAEALTLPGRHQALTDGEAAALGARPGSAR